MEIKDLVKDKEVEFIFYKEKELWYRVTGITPEFIFPVSIDDLGTAVLLPKDKALLFMRYIRKHKEMLEKARLEQGA